MIYEISHKTTYRYSDPVPLGHNLVHLAPRSFGRQECADVQLIVSPTPNVIENWTDYFGNRVTYFTVEEPHRELCVTSNSRVRIVAPTYPSPAATPPWEQVRNHVAAAISPECLSAIQFVYESPMVRRWPESREYALKSFLPGRPMLDAALDLTTRIWQDFKYDPAATNVNTPTPEVFKKRRGVCQDFAHLQISCLRSLELPARYVSGYLLTEPPPGQPKLVGADASHAWLSVFIPHYGWIDLDPTNNQIPTTRHITVAWGRDYSDVCPLKGIFLGGGAHSMSVAVEVNEIADVPANVGPSP